MKLDLTNLPKLTNKIYYQYFNNTQRYNIFFGSAGSGKSYFLVQRIFYKLFKEKGHNFLVIRKVDRTNRYSTFALLKQQIAINNWESLFNINKTDMTITFKYNGNQIACKGLDDPEKIKSITFESGILTDIWVEEATELTEDDFILLDLRLRGKTKIPKQMVISFNPISALHWIKKTFFDKKNYEDTLIVKTTFLDNEFLEESDRQALRNLEKVDPTYYKIYALGEWGIIGNVIFHNFVIENFNYNEQDFDAIYYGMDFGTNHPTAIIGAGIKDNEIYIFKELYLTGKTNTEIININEDEKVLDKKSICTADSAEPDRIKEWRQYGYQVMPAKKGKDSVRFGIDFLRRYRIHIHEKKCSNIATEFPTYKWREDKDGNVLDEPVGFKDDGIAALRYAFEGCFNNNEIRAGKISAGMLGF